MEDAQGHFVHYAAGSYPCANTPLYYGYEDEDDVDDDDYNEAL